VSYLLDLIIKHIPAPKYVEGPLQMQISSLDYSSYQGRIAIGRIYRGSIKPGQTVAVMKADGKIERSTVKELYTFEGLGKEKSKQELPCGEICAILGLDNFDIGDTVADPENPEELKRIHVDEPTMSMLFTINNSPFFGKEGKFVTSRHLRERLFKETEKNLALKIEETDSPEKLQVYGRGILHLAVLVETMRREGYELQLGQPKVIIKEENGVKYEPIELLTVEVPENFSSRVIDLVQKRKGDILNIESKDDRVFLEFNIPSRGIIGLTNPILTATEGEAIISHRFKDFEPWRGELSRERNGSLIAMETGTAIPYSINNLQSRGKFFISPGDEVYAGQIIGETTRQDDIVVNVTKTKKLTNMRAAGSDDKIIIEPATVMSLEENMEYINDDEYVEVTPKSIRLRKIILDEIERKRASRQTE
jgi:GTP-binding protein